MTRRKPRSVPAASRGGLPLRTPVYSRLQPIADSHAGEDRTFAPGARLVRLAMPTLGIYTDVENTSGLAHAHTLQESSCLTTSYSESAIMRRAKRSSSRHPKRPEERRVGKE